MVGLVLFVLVLALVVYGLERNHRRRRPPRSTGSVNFEDRDEGRAEIAAMTSSPPRTWNSGTGAWDTRAGAWDTRSGGRCVAS
jgi:hypothetical protein